MEVKRIQRSLLLPHPVKEVFRVVADVNEYSRFLPFCTHSSSKTTGPNEEVATLNLVYHGFKEEVTTLNRLVPHHRVELQLIEGPFESFDGTWTFFDLCEGCRVELKLEFAFSNIWVQRLSNVVLDRIVDQVLDAFTAQARSMKTR